MPKQVEAIVPEGVKLAVDAGPEESYHVARAARRDESRAEGMERALTGDCSQVEFWESPDSGRPCRWPRVEGRSTRRPLNLVYLPRPGSVRLRERARKAELNPADFARFNRRWRLWTE